MNVGLVNLHDWIDELCDVLDIETEVDEALVLDLARDAAHNVERRAAPDHDVPARLRRCAPRRPTRSRSSSWPARPPQLALRWDRPPDAVDPDEVEVEVEIPDDHLVDHTGDRYEA